MNSDTRRKPRQKRSKEKVGQILDAVEALATQHGLDALTTTQIAERTGFAVGTIYQYFGNRTELLIAAEERMFERLTQHLAGEVLKVLAEPVDEPIEKLIGKSIPEAAISAPAAEPAEAESRPERPRKQTRRGGRSGDRSGGDRSGGDRAQPPAERAGEERPARRREENRGRIVGLGDHTPAFLLRPVRVADEDTPEPVDS